MLLRRLAAAVIALPLLVTTGCGGDDPVKPKPFESPSGSTSLPATPSASSTPQAESAEDFVRRWVQAQNEMQVSGDTKEYRSLGYKCDACDGFADTIDKIYAAGGSVETLGWKILKFGGGPLKGSFEMRVDIQPTTYTESADGPEKRLAGDERTEIVQVIRRGTMWKTQSVTESRS